MQLRKQYLAQNSLGTLAISPSLPIPNTEIAGCPKWSGNLKESRARSESLAPDMRRETAQKAAKARWANWALKKTL